MLFLLFIQHSFFTRTLLCLNMCKAAEGGEKKNLDQLKETAKIQPSDWWPHVASSLSQWPHTQARLVKGRSLDCENGENRMEDEVRKYSEHSHPADINSHCKTSKSVCLSGGGWKPGLWLSGCISSWSAATKVKNFGCFCLFSLAPLSLEKIRFH